MDAKLKNGQLKLKGEIGSIQDASVKSSDREFEGGSKDKEDQKHEGTMSKTALNKTVKFAESGKTTPRDKKKKSKIDLEKRAMD